MNIEADDLSPMLARAEEASALMRALASPYRLMILCHLNGGEKSVGTLQTLVGLSQSALSQHLARLRADGLVATRREGQTIHYSLNGQPPAEVIGVLHRLYCESAPETATARGA